MQNLIRAIKKAESQEEAKAKTQFKYIIIVVVLDCNVVGVLLSGIEGVGSMGCFDVFRRHGRKEHFFIIIIIIGIQYCSLCEEDEKNCGNKTRKLQLSSHNKKKNMWNSIYWVLFKTERQLEDESLNRSICYILRLWAKDM